MCTTTELEELLPTQVKSIVIGDIQLIAKLQQILHDVCDDDTEKFSNIVCIEVSSLNAEATSRGILVALNRWAKEIMKLHYKSTL